MEFTKEEKQLLKCAFDIDDDKDCATCIIKDKCGITDFQSMGRDLLKKVGILNV